MRKWSYRGLPSGVNRPRPAYYCHCEERSDEAIRIFSGPCIKQRLLRCARNDTCLTGCFFVKGIIPLRLWRERLKFKRTLFIVCIVLLIVVAGLIYILPYLNSYQTDGTIALPGLSKPVTVIRDEKGMPYIKAENFEDAIMAQGFVTAQDRLFQMQLNRMMAQGRISELAGDKAIGLDTRMRTIGIHRSRKSPCENPGQRDT